jgi:hypothetical protein
MHMIKGRWLRFKDTRTGLAHYGQIENIDGATVTLNTGKKYHPDFCTPLSCSDVQRGTAQEREDELKGVYHRIMDGHVRNYQGVHRSRRNVAMLAISAIAALVLVLVVDGTMQRATDYTLEHVR